MWWFRAETVLNAVMRGLVPRLHVFVPHGRKTWMAGTEAGQNDEKLNRAQLTRRVAFAFAMLPLAACGFHPLYAENRRVADEPALAAIKVMPIADRMGQQLELSLREQLNPHDLSLETRYQLSITLAVSRADLGIQRDATATRGQVNVTAIIVLADAKTAKVLYRASAHSLSAFNVVNDAFAAQVAQDDSDLRTVRDLADEIRTRIAIFLQQHAG
jgi:LPS-assembly lipoprotein